MVGKNKSKHKMSRRMLLSAVPCVCGIGKLPNFPEGMQTLANLTFTLARDASTLWANSGPHPSLSPLPAPRAVSMAGLPRSRL